MLAILMSIAELAGRLPQIPTLKRWSQSLAVLDLVLGATADEHYFAFDAAWDDCKQLASMSNGSGDEYSIVFGPSGAFVRGFDHESQLSPWAFEPVAVVAGLLDDVPPALRDQIDEPAFTLYGVPALRSVQTVNLVVYITHIIEHWRDASAVARIPRGALSSIGAMPAP
jgi:hypothetical protein